MKRQKTPHPCEPHSSVSGSPKRSEQRMAILSAELKKVKTVNRTLAAQLRLRNGLDLNPGEKQDVINDVLVEAEEKGKEELAKLGFNEESIEAMIFEDAVENAKRAKASGTKRACRYF